MIGPMGQQHNTAHEMLIGPYLSLASSSAGWHDPFHYRAMPELRVGRYELGQGQAGPLARYSRSHSPTTSCSLCPTSCPDWTATTGLEDARQVFDHVPHWNAFL
jgi:hypothetical protein